jgi:hypothetical protein
MSRPKKPEPKYPKQLIIGFGHKARNGKDTAAEAIKVYYDQQNEKLSLYGRDGALRMVHVGIFKFATALYEEVNDAIRNGIWDTRYLSDDNIHLPDWVVPNTEYKPEPMAPYGKHPKLLQWWGTEFRRTHYGSDYWVNKLFASIPANLDMALVSDVRFANEADAIKQRGGYTVRVKRLSQDGSQFFAQDRPSDHPSETELDDYNWSFNLVNQEGHQALLQDQAITLAEYLKGLHS